jgi:hypothetical protein
MYILAMIEFYDKLKLIGCHHISSVFAFIFNLFSYVEKIKLVRYSRVRLTGAFFKGTHPCQHNNSKAIKDGFSHFFQYCPYSYKPQ